MELLLHPLLAELAKLLDLPGQLLPPRRVDPREPQGLIRVRGDLGDRSRHLQGSDVGDRIPDVGQVDIINRRAVDDCLLFDIGVRRPRLGVLAAEPVIVSQAVEPAGVAGACTTE